MAKDFEEDFIPYAEYEWITVNDSVLTIGITEEGLDELSEITSAELPTENTVVDADEVCGELDTRDGPLHLYVPVRGNVIEVNASVIENPELISEDPMGDGWLIRVEAESPQELADFLETANKKAARTDDEEDEDDDDDDDLDLDEDDEDYADEDDD
ncbi:MAG: glycine cleavage system protein H [Bdellovibrionales bacterium]